MIGYPGREVRNVLGEGRLKVQGQSVVKIKVDQEYKVRKEEASGENK